MRRHLTAGVLATIALTGPVWGQDTAVDASTVLAKVNGTEITLGHAIVMRDRLPQQYQEMPDDVLLNGIVEQLVDQALLAAEESASPETDPLEVRLHLENERRGTLAARVVEARIAQPVDAAKLQAAYEAEVAAFQPQPEFNASHILVDSEARAKQLLSDIEGGADFAELAKANSKDGSAAGGGELGWFGPGRMVPEFETAVTGMEPGAVAGPVQTQFGWHLIRLNEKRDTSMPPLEQIQGELENTVREDALRAELATLRAAATIAMPESPVPPAAIRDGALLTE